MDILKQFGIQPILLAAQIVNFLILLFILRKFLYGPLLKVLDERKKRIADSLKNAEEIEKRLQETEEKSDQVLRTAADEAQKIVDEGKASVVQMLEDGRQKTASQVESMIKQGQEAIKAEREKMQQEVKEELADLVLAILQKVTGKVISKKEQQQLIKKGVKEFNA